MKRHKQLSLSLPWILMKQWATWSRENGHTHHSINGWSESVALFIICWWNMIDEREINYFLFSQVDSSESSAVQIVRVETTDCSSVNMWHFRHFFSLWNGITDTHEMRGDVREMQIVILVTRQLIDNNQMKIPVTVMHSYVYCCSRLSFGAFVSDTMNERRKTRYFRILQMSQCHCYLKLLRSTVLPSDLHIIEAIQLLLQQWERGEEEKNVIPSNFNLIVNDTHLQSVSHGTVTDNVVLSCNTSLNVFTAILKIVQQFLTGNHEAH